jgi:hypothetical protein
VDERSRIAHLNGLAFHPRFRGAGLGEAGDAAAPASAPARVEYALQPEERDAE